MTITKPRPSAPRPRLAVLAAAFLLALTMSACGSGGNAGATDDQDPVQAEIDDAHLEYAQCMREHGVDMDDPKPGGGLLLEQEEGDDPATLRKAQKACQSILDDVIPEDGGPSMPAEEKEALLAQAKCMRDRGWNVPDPEFDGGKVTQRLEAGKDGVDPNDPQFQKDQAECAEESGVEAPGAPDAPEPGEEP